MANIKSAKKRIRQNEKRRVHNRQYRAAARTFIKAARTHIAAGEFDQAEAQILQASKVLDKAARRRILHPNNAARRKGRIMQALVKAKAEAGVV